MIGKTIDELSAGDVAEVVHRVDADGVAEFVDAVGDHNPIHSEIRSTRPAPRSRSPSLPACSPRG